MAGVLIRFLHECIHTPCFSLSEGRKDRQGRQIDLAVCLMVKWCSLSANINQLEVSSILWKLQYCEGGKISSVGRALIINQISQSIIVLTGSVFEL